MQHRYFATSVTMRQCRSCENTVLLVLVLPIMLLITPGAAERAYQ